jgi:hypothetical protein
MATILEAPPEPSHDELEALIEEARRRARRRRLLIGGGILGTLLLAGLATGLVLGLRGGSSTAVPRGYHVVQAKGTVDHVLVDERRGPEPRLVDIGDGSAHVAHVQQEVWWDAKSGLVRVVGRVGGRIQYDVVGQRCQTAAGSKPFRFCDGPDPFFLARKGFRLPVRAKHSRLAGRGVVRGHHVVWVESLSPTGYSSLRPVPTGDQVALDVRTHEPIAHREVFRLRGHRFFSQEFYSRLPDLPASRVRFVVPDGGAVERGYPPAGQGVFNTDQRPLGETHDVVGRPPLWLGPSFQGHRLRSVKVGSVGQSPEHGPRVDTVPFVLLDYGIVRLREFGRGPFWLRQGPPPGKLLFGYSGVDVNYGGLLISVESSRLGGAPARANALRIARGLRPVP